MRGMWSRLPAAALILTLGAVACSPKSDTAANGQEAAGQLPAGHPAITPGQQVTMTAPGTVAETMDAAGYTYARLTGPNGQDIWTAGPQTKLEVGQSVALVNPITMTNFASKTLNRTFDKIYFTERFAAPDEAATANASNAAHQPSAGAAAAAVATQGVVEETIDSGGYTYLQVKTGDKSLWLAAPQMKVKKGARVSWTVSMTMTNFTSKTLNRTFDQILFVQDVSVVSDN